MNRRVTLLKLANIAGYSGMVVINILANILPIGGKNTGELSAQYPNLFVPAGYTFSIWGLIYVMLLLYTIFQASEQLQEEKSGRELNQRVGWLFFLTCLLNVAWIFVWHYELVLLSVIVMFLLLISLVRIYLRLGIGKREFSKAEKIFVQIPFSLYLGWITIATVANVTALLVQRDWNRFGLSEWTWFGIMIGICVLIEIIVYLKHRDVVFNLVAIWAFIGILVANLAIF